LRGARRRWRARGRAPGHRYRCHGIRGCVRRYGRSLPGNRRRPRSCPSSIRGPLRATIRPDRSFAAEGSRRARARSASAGDFANQLFLALVGQVDLVGGAFRPVGKQLRLHVAGGEWLDHSSRNGEGTAGSVGDAGFTDGCTWPWLEFVDASTLARRSAGPVGVQCDGGARPRREHSPHARRAPVIGPRS